MQIPILRGHPFSKEGSHPSDLSPAVISAAMAHKYWPNENPLGKKFLAAQNRGYEVIGLVPNVSTLHLGQQDGPLFYGQLDDTSGAARFGLSAFQPETRQDAQRMFWHRECFVGFGDRVRARHQSAACLSRAASLPEGTSGF
jgi:hypothetical protein